MTIILYHQINSQNFERHIVALKKRYNFIHFRDYIKARENHDYSLPEKAMIITFDDGYSSNYELLPIIQKYDVPVIMFICSSIMDTNRKLWSDYEVQGYSTKQFKKMPNDERRCLMNDAGFEEQKEFSYRSALNSQEIREMSNIVEFQSHTRYHSVLPNCSDQIAAEEIGLSKKELEEKLGLNIQSLSYPCGDYSNRDIKLAKEAGYRYGFTVDHHFNTLNTDSYRLRRLCIPDDADVNEALVNASGLKIFLRSKIGKLDYGYTENGISNKR